MTNSDEALTPLYYAECTACDWRVEFSRGAYISDLNLETSARRRLAGHSSSRDCTSDDHVYGPLSMFGDPLEPRGDADV